MRECWINVYELYGSQYLGAPWSNKEFAIYAYTTVKPVYRIHVRMK